MIHLLNTITTGDARELSKEIPDGSIDLIFTDPPYPKEYLPLYGWLGEEAKRVLKPAGVLLTYTGLAYKLEVMSMLGRSLDYFWDYAILHPGRGSMFWPRLTVSAYKSLLAYSRGETKPRHKTQGAIVSKRDKTFHEWGQGLNAVVYYMDCFSHPGDIIWEPFCGGGTTPTACVQLNRNFIAFEVNPDTANIARKRLETVQPLLMPEMASQLTLESGVVA